VWEEVLRDDLLELLASINMSMEDDIWVCKPGGLQAGVRGGFLG
jgi:hypothetical protein